MIAELRTRKDIENYTTKQRPPNTKGATINKQNEYTATGATRGEGLTYILQTKSAVLSIRNQKAYKRNNTHKCRHALNVSKATPPDNLHRRAANGPSVIRRIDGGPLVAHCCVAVEIITRLEMTLSTIYHKTRPTNSEITV